MQRVGGFELATALVLMTVGVAGCGLWSPVATQAPSPTSGPGAPSHNATQVHPQRTKATAEFFWPYAVMAAAVYSSKGRVNQQLTLASASPWLRRELGENAPSFDPEKAYGDWIDKKCKDVGARSYTYQFDDSAVRAAEGRCREGDKPEDQEEEQERELEEQSGQGFLNRVPAHWTDCEFRGPSDQDKPAVPLLELEGEGWTPAPELQRQLHPRGWSFFVPGLAIDVWRKPRGTEGGSPVVEYALVFRGTAERGGWLSNLRALTAFTPLVWDQYRQARRATTDLVNQIYMLHALSDAVLKREKGTRIKITAVGHSLGGGLANYVLLRVPQITRVVSFDPSPVDGSTVFSPQDLTEEELKRGWRDRRSVFPAWRAPLDRIGPRADWIKPGDDEEQASILVLYEKGDVVTKIFGCNAGPIWGREGGPIASCSEVNLSGGGAFEQHKIEPLACKLYLAKRGLQTRGP